MILKRKLSLFSYFHIISLSMFIAFTAIFLFLTIRNAHQNFEQEAIIFKTTYVEEKKKILKNEVTRFVDYIYAQQHDGIEKGKKVVEERVIEAYDIATALHEKYKHTHSAAQIKSMIIETLSMIHFENNTGYYFVIDNQKGEILLTDRKELEGKNKDNFKNAEGRYIIQEMISFVRAKREGFFDYSFSKPNQEGLTFKKISYLKLFEPYNLSIGTGLYRDEIEQKIKNEITSNTPRLMFDTENKNYIFISTWKGLALTYPATGKNMYTLQDKNGKFLVQELIEVAQNGGGFVEYVMPSIANQRNEQKLSYVLGIRNWEWYVGAGLYIDDINTEIDKLRENMEDGLQKSIISIILTVLGFSIVLWACYFYISRKLKEDFELFSVFFDSLENNEKKLELKKIKFSEFALLAEHANAMLEAKIKADIYLERYQKIVSKSDDFLAYIDNTYTYLAVSKGYLDFFDKNESEIVGKTIPELFGQTYFDKELKSSCDRVLGGEIFEREYWIKSPSGEYYFLHVKYFPYISSLDKGTENIQAYVVSARDMTDKKINDEKLLASEKELDYLAHNDSLTGLPNRHLLHDRISHAITLSARNNMMLGLCFLDLDNFKKINDSFGHSYGDEILIQFSKRVESVIRSCDTLSRIGGDEFILMVENITKVSEIEPIIKKLQSVFNKPFTVKEQKFFLTASVGISFYPEQGLESETLIKNADAAMYKAKSMGRNTYAFYTTDMTIASYERIGIENALREAVLLKQFVVYYQPQIDLKTNALIGLEALVRWSHPSEGILAPGKFIAIAEETRLIIDIGSFVLEQACEDIISLHQAQLFKGTVSVNVSGVQIEYSDFLKTLQEIISTTGVSAEILEMEITESFIMNDPEKWIALLNDMRRLGVKIAIDDFGTGHSSLSYLRKLPIDKLKVDMSFVRDIPHHEDACAIVNSIISLARNMKIETLAEGIETKEQEVYLKEHHCDGAQGYLYAKPMSFNDLKVWIRNRSASL